MARKAVLDPTTYVYTRTLTHTAPVTSLVLCAEESTLFTGSADGALRPWLVETGVCVRTLQAHTEVIIGLLWSLEAQSLYSISRHGICEQWAVPSCQHVRTLGTYGSEVWASVLSLEGRFLFLGCVDSTIKQWDLETGTCLRTLAGHTDCVSALVVSAEDGSLYSGSTDRKIKQWHVETGECLRTFEGCMGLIHSLVLSADHRTLYAGQGAGLCQYGTITSYELRTGQWVKLVGGQESDAFALTCSSKESYLFSGSVSPAVIQWDMETLTCVRTLTGHTDLVLTLVCSSVVDRGILFSGSADRTVRQWTEVRASDLSRWTKDQLPTVLTAIVIEYV